MLFDSFIKLYSRFIGLLYPALCQLCRGPATFYICPACWQDLPSLPHSCIQCAQILPDAGLKCGPCLNHPPAFDCVYALFPYAPPISELIIQLKFQHKLHYAHALGKLLAVAISQWYAEKQLPELIIPVPLHPSRLRERGFNQAVEIARPISRAFAIPLDKYNVMRIKPTATQSSLPATKRKKNTAGAFQSLYDYSGMRIAILDDVMTTGHTVNALSALLKKQGAVRIDIWCCARRS